MTKYSGHLPDDLNELLVGDGVRSTDSVGAPVYRRLVRLLRVVLGLLVFVLVAAVLLWPEIERQTAPKLDQVHQKISSNELVKPKFYSADGDLQPFTLSADRAVQNNTNPDLVDLENPKGDITLKDQTVLQLSAQKGAYQQNNQIMSLHGNVRLTQGQAYEMQGKSVTIDMKTQNVSSDEPVVGSGSFGSIKASGLEGYGARGIMIFRGPATLILNEGNQP